MSRAQIARRPVDLRPIGGTQMNLPLISRVNIFDFVMNLEFYMIYFTYLYFNLPFGCESWIKTDQSIVYVTYII